MGGVTGSSSGSVSKPRYDILFYIDHYYPGSDILQRTPEVYCYIPTITEIEIEVGFDAKFIARNKGRIFGYVLMVIYNNSIEDGTAYAWPMTEKMDDKSILLGENNHASGHLNSEILYHYPNAIENRHRFVIDIDTPDHPLKYIIPVSFDPKIDPVKYRGCTYFGNTSYPYCYSKAEADTAIASGTWPKKNKNYTPCPGTGSYYVMSAKVGFLS